jgi:homoserine O-acetyltransferase
MKRFADANVEAQYFELESDFGHLASGLDCQKWEPALRELLQS